MGLALDRINAWIQPNPPLRGKTEGHPVYVTARIDADILDWFRKQVEAQGGGNYQTMINQVLRDYVSGHQLDLEEVVRRVVREEFARYKTD